jgi:3-oxoacyl-[acyl-carrier-protein] synthase-1
MNPPLLLDVVALGARLPVGLTPESGAAAIRAGISRISEHPYLLDGAGEPLKCARDALLDQAAHGVDRLAPLIEHVCVQVSRELKDVAGVRCSIALPEERPGFDSLVSRELLDRLRSSGPARATGLDFEVFGRGHAGVFEGLARARASIESGAAEVCVVAGVDSYLHADTLAWLDSDRRIARSGVRAGFIPGEGAAALAVMSERTRKRLGLRSQARLCAIGHAVEPRDLESHEGLLGEGLSSAVRLATRELAAGAVIDDVYADINGERHRAEDWGFTLLRSPVVVRRGTDYVTSSSNCGDVGAATAALQVLLAARAWARGYASGPRALAFAGSWSGARGAIILEAANE